MKSKFVIVEWPEIQSYIDKEGLIIIVALLMMILDLINMGHLVTLSMKSGNTK